jgi:hypothetical protein
LEEARRIKEEKRRENQMKEDYVRDLIKREQEARRWNWEYKDRLRTGMQQALIGQVMTNQSLSKEVKT